jgi:uncharacterized membrane protein
MQPRFGKGEGIERITAFSDGVFAIAITLLVLNLHVPDLSHDTSSAALIAALLADLPNVQAYVMSFLVVGLFWTTHQRTFAFIRRYDTVLIWLNLLLLLCVCVLPFPTAIVGRFVGPVPVMIYAANLALVSLLQLTIWWYATSQHRLVDPDLPVSLIHLGALRGLTTMSIFLTSIVVAFYDATVAMLCWLLLPLALALSRRAYRQEQAADEHQALQSGGG